MVVTVRDGYNFLRSENISSLSRNLCTKQPKRRHLGCILQRSHSACDWSNERQWVHLLKYGHHLWFYFEQTMWTKDLSYYGWNEPQTFVIFFSNEESSAKTNLIKRAKQRKLLMKIWMMSMIQQKKLPPELKENSSCDGLKATHGWIMIKKTTAWSAVYVTMFG